MVSRIQNRNTGYSENLFSQNQRMESNTLNSIDGATALKLDESYQIEEEEINNSVNGVENNLENQSSIGNSTQVDRVTSSIPSGVSIESASYIIENNNLEETDSHSDMVENNEEEYTPKLFSEEQNYQLDEIEYETNNEKNNDTKQLFDQDVNEEEDFEIPAFLRKQKF